MTDIQISYILSVLEKELNEFRHGNTRVVEIILYTDEGDRVIIEDVCDHEVFK